MLSFKPWFRFLATFSSVLFGFGQFCSSQAGPIVRFNRDHEPPPLKRANAGQLRSAERFLGWRYAAMAKQDTSKWVRTRASQVSPRTNIIGERATRPMLGQSSSASSFSVAGFASPAKLPTGYIPTAVVQGDFNGDGKMDLAISNGGDDTIYVYLGKGDGSFALPEVLYTQGQAPVWLAAAQLRTGGHTDLIAVDGDSGQVEVFFGNGDGTFQTGTFVASLTQAPTFVLAGDFNRDGHIDLAIGFVVDAYATQPQYEVLLGDGSGAFPSTLTPPLVVNNSDSALPTDWMALGDLNNDGYLDVVTTVAFGGAIAYLNQAGMGFTQGSIFNPTDTAVAVGLGDMNGDGCLDAVQTGTYGWLSIAKGNCDGTFTQSGPTAEVGDVAYAVATADVNGDGKLDVVASSAFTDSEIIAGIGAYGGYFVSVLTGDGSGNFAPTAVYRVGADAYSFAVSDLNGTGRPNIVTISETESTSSLLVNDGSGGFGHTSGEAIGYLSGVTNAPVPSGKPQTVDVNGDGKPDVVLIEFGQNSTFPSLISVLLNDGAGKLGAPIRSPITVGSNVPYPLFVAGNFRSAKAADLVYLSQYDSNSLAFFPGNGDGTFGSGTPLSAPPNPYQIVSGDFNGDGKLDFALFGYSSSSFTTTELDVFLGNGDGTFNHLAPQTFPALTTQLPSQLIAGDFTHDCKLDLLLDNSGYDLDLLQGNGDGTFQAPHTLMSNFGSVSVGDFNGDGYPDLLQPEDPDSITEGAITAAGGPFSAAAFTIYLSGPGASFTKGASYSVPGVLGGYPLVGDFNGDGNPDVALPVDASTIGRPWEARLQIFQGNGDGTFAANGIPYQLPAYDLPVVGGDYRGLGVTDLLDLIGSTSSINTISASPAPALAVTPDSSPLTGTEASATVALSLPPTSSQTVTLSASDPAVTIPGSVTFSAGQTQQSISFSIGSGFDSSHLLAVTANLGGQSAVGYFAKSSQNLAPGVNALIEASTSGTNSVATSPGGSIPLLLTLQSVGGYSGIFAQFECSGLPANAQCTFANSSVQLLPGGYGQVAFEVTTTSDTPMGTYNIRVGASNGEISPSASLGFGVGGFSINADPALIQTNLATSAPNTYVTANYTNGFTQPVQLSCSGLPSGASCSISGVLFPNVPATVGLNVSPDVPAQDYPFVIAGTTGGVSSNSSATLRVSTLGATVTPASASVKRGQSATFNVQLQSLNHFSNNNIQITCQTSANVTCSIPNQYNSLGDGATLTIPLKVIAQTTSGAVRATRPWKLQLPAFLACMVALFVPVGRRRRRIRTGFGILMVLSILTSTSACGGASSNGSAGGGGTGPTPQTATIVVSAQAPTATGSLQVNAGTITLTIN
jgi:FG-GAP-like repeat/FG-GAP repeat